MSRSSWVWVILVGALLFTGGVALVSVSPTVKKIAEAIATAEGFYIPGTRPQRDNNPGDIEADLIGKAVSWDGPFPMYATVQDGWQNLYTQVSAMLNGLSSHYNPVMTITQVAQIYAPQGWLDWSQNVANALGVSTDTPLNQIT